jgi:hypothetical protein
MPRPMVGRPYTESRKKMKVDFDPATGSSVITANVSETGALLAALDMAIVTTRHESVRAEFLKLLHELRGPSDEVLDKFEVRMDTYWENPR